jgi:DNA-binding response OmpR family regulator
LREKLAANADAVETVRGVGYRLREGWTTEPA